MVSPRTARIFGRIWVTFTVLLIAFIAYSVQIFVIYPWYGSEVSVDLLQLLGPFNVLVGMLYWNYFMTVFTNPGSVPRSWKPEGEDYEVKKLTGGPRFCRSCQMFKPPRAHHCRQCRRCILRMDHHCPWVNNCVGHFNYAHFIRFLVYVDISCSYHLWMLTARAYGAYNTAQGYWIEPSTRELVFIILNYVACVPVILTVGVFSGYHIYCLLTNTTTIEGWEKDKVATLIRRGKIREIKFPYNLGLKENLYSALGPSPLYWPFPIKEKSSGLKFRIADGEGKWIEFHRNDYEMEDAVSRGGYPIQDPSSQEIWPPQDPYKQPEYTGPVHDFSKDTSPWTYGNGVNPNLQPFNAYRRNQAAAGRANVPPYHPAYRPQTQPSGGLDSDDERQSISTPSRHASSDEYDHPPEEYDHPSDEDDNEMTYWDRPKVRRGSEGFEVREETREEILRRYIESRGEEAGRYRRYIPETPTISDDEESLLPLNRGE